MGPKQGTGIRRGHQGRQGAVLPLQRLAQGWTQQAAPTIGVLISKQLSRIGQQGQAVGCHLHLAQQLAVHRSQAGQGFPQLGQAIDLKPRPLRGEREHQLHRGGVLADRQAQPLLHCFGAGRQQRHPFAQPLDGFLQGSAGRLIQFIDLGDIERLLEHAATGGDQDQVVIDQRRGQGLGVLPQQRPPAADQAHAAIARDLQIGARQAAGLPEALQEATGPFVVTAAQGQDPAGGLLATGWGQQSEAAFIPKPRGEFGGIVQACGGKRPIAQAIGGGGGLAALPRRGDGPGVGSRLIRTDEPVQAEGRGPRDEAGRQRHGEGLVLQREGTALQQQPPARQAEAQHRQRHRQQCRQEGAGLHALLTGLASSLCIKAIFGTPVAVGRVQRWQLPQALAPAN